ncbi:hypothetical protein GCM10022221_49380 [Actinocorallia aurea]
MRQEQAGGRPWTPPGEISVRELPLPAHVQVALEEAGLGRAAASEGYGAAGLLLRAPLLTPESARAVAAVFDLLAAPAPDEDDLIGPHLCTVGWEPTAAVTARYPIEELDLPVRPYNLLKRAGLHSVGDLREILGRLPEAVPRLGPTGLAAVESALAALDNEPHR